MAQPLISEARSFSNSERVRSKLAAASSSIDVRCQTVISEGAAAKRSIFVVMIGFLLLLPISWRAGISRCDVRAEILILPPWSRQDCHGNILKAGQPGRKTIEWSG
ncbi:hypothetical protein [Rhizobium ruizarguesonis]|uniref:hypothetical protein n=1 Tax=Rhizobium ruizarguesonis TaxID=2081791 RepID=UPI001FE06907|nr:hypothetical protein [Rhizobium ruizarguesonis]